MALKVLDRAMQAFGAEGICQDQPLAQMFAGLRTLRYADVSIVPKLVTDYISIGILRHKFFFSFP
jgi:hypothetical protein